MVLNLRRNEQILGLATKSFPSGYPDTIRHNIIYFVKVAFNLNFSGKKHTKKSTTIRHYYSYLVNFSFNKNEITIIQLNTNCHFIIFVAAINAI